MTLKADLEVALADLNASQIKVDKTKGYVGEDATKVSFRMTDPLGLDTGVLEFETFFVEKLKLSNERMAALTRLNAEAAARNHLFGDHG